MISVFPKSLKTPQRNKLENITLRGFAGGWNAIETDMQMESSFLVTSRNFRRTPGGTQKVRYGSRWLADLITVTVSGDIIVDMEYFASHLICALSSGIVVAVAQNGTKTVIWNSAIAAALPGTPAGWSSGLDSIDFVPYKDELILHNGVDKPITIDSALVVTYLQDLATGSNVNTPIGKYGCVVQNYHVIAGVAVTPTQIYVSSIGTAGTFFGDPAPNDSIVIDIGAYSPQGAFEIRGVAGFRGNLLVFFAEQTVIVKLGVYDSGVHTPQFPDAMPTFGLLGHRCITPIENDIFFAGLSSVATVKRNLLAGTQALEGSTLSDRIEPPYRETIGNLTDEEQLKTCWMVHDALSHDVLLFTPTNRTFVYSFNTKLRYAAWSEYSDLNVQCGCRTALGRVFYADGLRIFQHGNVTFENELFYKDRILNRDSTWANNTGYPVGTLVFDNITGEVFRCISPHISSVLPATFAEDRALLPPLWTLYEGVDFSFQIELPWLDSKDPMRIKFLRFISMATKGDAEFTINAYVDNLFKDVNGTIIWDHSLSMRFIGNEAAGFGYDAGPYGGGRRSDDPRLFKFPAKFKKIKFTLNGERGGNLEIVNMSFLFSRGRYKR